MSHMQCEVTEQQWWYEVDGPCGTEWVPEDLCGQLDGAVLGQTSSDAARPVPGELSGYCENRTAWTIVRKQGFGARLSASGYTDCTEWSVFETKSDAEDHLFEMYEQCPECDMPDDCHNDDECGWVLKYRAARAAPKGTKPEDVR